MRRNYTFAPAVMGGRSTTQRRSVWWLNPAIAFLVVVFPVAFVAWRISPETYLLLWNTPKYYDGNYFGMTLVLAFAFATGATIGAKVRVGSSVSHKSPVGPSGVLVAAFWVAFWLTMLGYASWAIVAVRNGVSWSQVVSILQLDPGAADALKTAFTTVPGLTTATQFGMAASILGSNILLGRKSLRIKLAMTVIMLVAGLRSVLLSERLALLEIAVPVIVLLAREKITRGSRLKRFGYAALPVIGVLAVTLFFSITEYFRSWAVYRVLPGSTFWQFIMARLTGYYVTSMNNAALYFDSLGVLPLPLFSLAWLWSFPLFREFLNYEALTGVSVQYLYGRILAEYANPEFNTSAGLLLTAVDFGIAGALLYWIAAGLLSGILYRSFIKGRITGSLLYPFVYVAILEVPRILYHALGRAFPTWVFLNIRGRNAGNPQTSKHRDRRYPGWIGLGPRADQFRHRINYSAMNC